MKKIIYLDNAATTKPFDIVLKKYNNVSEKIFGNPSSLHSLGVNASKIINEAREKIANTLQNVSKEEIIFTSCGTESNNMIIKGLVANKSIKHLITTRIEHPSVLNVFKTLEKDGLNISYLDVDESGLIDLNQLKNLIKKETDLVSIIHTNNETGVVQNIEKIGKIIKDQNSRTLFHIDAVQSYGKKIINPPKCCIDFISLSAHKIHGLKGAGALYIKKNIKIKPLFEGGNQEYGLRSGTENVAAISAFGVAAENIYKSYKEKYSVIYSLFIWFINELKNNFKDIKINSPYDIESSFSPFILNVSFPYLKGEVILHSLEKEGIYVSTGSACHSKTKLKSYVLQNISVSKKYIDGSIRFSFSYETTKDELKTVLNILNKVIEELKLYFISEYSQ